MKETVLDLLNRAEGKVEELAELRKALFESVTNASSDPAYQKEIKDVLKYPEVFQVTENSKVKPVKGVGSKELLKELRTTKFSNGATTGLFYVVTERGSFVGAVRDMFIMGNKLGVNDELHMLVGYGRPLNVSNPFWSVKNFFEYSKLANGSEYTGFLVSRDPNIE